MSVRQMAPRGVEPGFFGTLGGFLDFGLGEILGDGIPESGSVDNEVSIFKGNNIRKRLLFRKAVLKAHL